MVRDCAEIKYLQYFTLLGRKGQNQHGGDVASQDWKTIIQCKCYDQNKGKAAYDLLVDEIKEEYAKACGHFLEMDLFVVATTLDRDLPTQEAIRKIAGDIPIQTLFWEDLAPLYERFGEKYKLKEIRLTLDKALIRDRDNHPSFRLMKLDELDKRLLRTYEAQEFEPRTEQDGIVSPVWSRIRETWKDGRNRSVIIEGAGGIGKTVALFTIPRAKPAYAPPPAIYIPMYRLVDEKGNCQTISNYFADKFSALNSALDHVTKRTWEEGPGLLLLLDGFNEVSSDKRRTALRHINDWRKDHPGAQLIVVSRPMDNIDLEHELAGEPLPPLKLKPLDEKQARGFLSDRGLAIPAAGPIWKILTYPLFLVLYAKTGCLPRTTSSGYPLDVRDASSGGALIWNYLQRELLRDDREDMETWVIRSAIANEYLIPKIAYEMVRNHQFSIQRTALCEIIKDGVDSLTLSALPIHLGELFDTYKDHHPGRNIDLVSFSWSEVVLQETEMFSEHQDRQERGRSRRADKQYGFLHQNFRDCLAGLYLVNQAEMAEKNKFPEIWSHNQSHLALEYAAELMNSDLFHSLWEANREAQKQSISGNIINHTSTFFKRIWKAKNEAQKRSEDGTRTNNTATYNLLELCKRNENLPQELDFSGMDLRGLSLTHYLGKDGRALPLFRNCTLSKGTLLDRSVFESSGHGGVISALAILPDERIVSGSRDSTLRVWDVTTGECQQTMEGHTGFITCIAVLPDGRVVSGSADHTLRVWDVATGKCLQTLKGHTNSIYCVAVLNDGRVVSGSRDCTLRVWDVATGKCLQTLEGHNNIVTCVAVLPNGSVVSGSADSTLRVWDATMGEWIQILEGHGDWITCVAVLPDGRVVSGSWDRTLRVWDVSTGQCQNTLKEHINWVICVTVLPDGRVVSGSRDRTLRVWDATTGQCQKTLEGHTNWVTCVTVLPDGRVVSGSDDCTMRIWDVATGEWKQTMEGHANWVTCVTVLPDGRVVSGTDDRFLRVWDISVGQCQRILPGHANWVTCVSVFSDGRVVSGSRDNTLRVWDVTTDQCQQTLSGHKDWVRCVAVLPDGRVVSGSDDCTLRVWDVATGKCKQTLEGHSNWVRCVAVLSDVQVVSGSDDCTLRVWNVETGECEQTMEGYKSIITCVAVLPGGWVIYGSDDSTLRIWDPNTGLHLGPFECTEIDVSQMNISMCELPEDLAVLLWRNGALITEKDYEQYVMPDIKRCKQDYYSEYSQEVIIDSNNPLVTSMIMWPETYIESLLPSPPSNDVVIYNNSEERFNCRVAVASKENWSEYVALCENSGFILAKKKDRKYI